MRSSREYTAPCQGKGGRLEEQELEVHSARFESGAKHQKKSISVTRKGCWLGDDNSSV